MQQLQTAEIKGREAMFIKNYLHNWTTTVRINTTVSDSIEFENDVS